MADKSAPLTLESSDGYEERQEIKSKQGEAVGTVVTGVALLFLSSFHWGMGAGGVLMVLWGGWKYARYGRLARQAYDPWDDEELDAWEEEQLGR